MLLAVLSPQLPGLTRPGFQLLAAIAHSPIGTRVQRFEPLDETVHRLNQADQGELLAALALLIAAGLCLALVRGWALTGLAVLAVLVGGFAWLEVDQQHEGRILFTISSSHGITETDLVFPLVVLLALLVRLLLAIRRRRQPRRPGSSGGPGAPAEPPRRGRHRADG